MKKNIKVILSLLVVTILTIVELMLVSDLTEREDSKEKYAQFHNEEENFDVLFFGSSHVMNGIFPMELWKDYGIVSYNMAGHGNHIPVSYWMLKMALEYTNPKLVVIDTYTLSFGDKVASKKQLHQSMDHFPYNLTKEAMIQDLLDTSEDQSEFRWKFSIYHNRWNELEKSSFVPEICLEKGAESRIGVAIPDTMVEIDADFKIPENADAAVGVAYLYRIINECRERGIEILFTYIPYADDWGGQGESNFMQDIATESGVDFLDFYTLLDQINLNTDMYDSSSHLNPSGARKISNYIGNYIMLNYDIEDHREDERYSGWYDDYEVYMEFKVDNIREQSSLQNYLMLLSDKNFSYGIYLKSWKELTENPVLVELLAGMEFDGTQIPNEKCFVFVDRATGEHKAMGIKETMETEYANFSLFYNKEGQIELSNSKSDSMIVSEEDMAVVVFNNNNKSFVDKKCLLGKIIKAVFKERRESQNN